MINGFNLLILFGLMIPNILYAISFKDIKHVKKNKIDEPEEVVATQAEKTALEELLYADEESEDEWITPTEPDEFNFNVDWQAEVEGIIQKAKDRKNKKADPQLLDSKKKARMRRLNALVAFTEGFGRIASMILMIVPFGVLEFEFSNKENFIIYVFGNIIFMLAYWFVWIRFFKKRTFKRAMGVSVLSTLIFLLVGLTLDHWWLALTAVLYGVCHTGGVLESVWEE